MQFIDEVHVRAEAGHGGSGCVAFRREKYVPRGGPAGGDGGAGGSVVFVGSRNTNTLYHLRHRRLLKAERGRHGEGSLRTGRSGEDLVIKVPLGTIVYAVNASSRDDDDQDQPFAGQDAAEQAPVQETGPAHETVLGEVTEDGYRLVVARGGQGGRGNARFATATRQAPRYAQPGEEGEERSLRCELKLLADVGVVGLPNAGKSTMISSITAATPKIADYPFTTLVPQLGVVARGVLDEPFVIADLPGLIEGAAQGAGLGHRFLRHVERCRVLVHLVDLSYGEIGAAEELATIEEELRTFDPLLMERPRVVVGTKIDAIDAERSSDLRAAVEQRSLPYLEISSVTHKGTDAMVAKLGQMLEQAPEYPVAGPQAGLAPGVAEPERTSLNDQPARRLTIDDVDALD